MAAGVGSEEIVIAMGRAGLIGFFGAGGLGLPRIERAVCKVQETLCNGESYGFNLLSNPADPQAEMNTAELYARCRVPRVSASGYVRITPPLVLYRAIGMRREADGRIDAEHRVFAKISRTEVARQFMEPPPEAILRQLVAEKRITEDQARMAALLPLADDVTAEADSAGHTDNQPFLPLRSTIGDLRDEIMADRGYPHRIRVGAAGGICTPPVAMAAFVAGADYVLVGSVHQSCVEAGTSDLVKEMLCQTPYGKVAMAPAGDMFEMGTKVQVSAHKTLFAHRARKLWDLYHQYSSLEEIPSKDREQLETRFFRFTFDEVWQQVLEFVETLAPTLRDAIEGTPKRKMAAVFKWYLHMSSRWAVEGIPDRQVDFQIWCGPAMAAFNQWVKGSFLEEPKERRVVQVATNLMCGTATLLRARILTLQGVNLPTTALNYQPRRFPSEERTLIRQPAAQPIEAY
jgi:PfaD family protein